MFNKSYSLSLSLSHNITRVHDSKVYKLKNHSNQNLHNAFRNLFNFEEESIILDNNKYIIFIRSSLYGFIRRLSV